MDIAKYRIVKNKIQIFLTQYNFGRVNQQQGDHTVSHFETLQQAMSPLFMTIDALCPCRRPPSSKGEDLCPEGRSEIQSKDRLQGKVDT